MTKDQGDIGAESADDQQVQQEPAGTPGDQQTETLQSQLEEEKARAERCLANWQRAEADLANFKRRAEQERAELIKFANASLIEKILPVLDDFERAIGAVPQDQQTTGWVEGIKLIDRKLRNVLEQEGVVPIEALGKEFDPYVHEAVLREEGEGDVDVVVEEIQKGYKLHDRVIRPTMVKVGKQRSDNDKDNKE